MSRLRMKNFIWYWLPALAYAGLIYRISAVPGSNIPGLFPYQDVVFHFFEYAGFAILLSRAIRSGSYGKNKARLLLIVMTAAIVYAFSDEFHQLFVPGRTASVADLAVDFSGSFFAVLFYNNRVKQ
jgi:VanZ family protein